MEKQEILKNLEYMHHHNEHHQEELAQMANETGGKTKEIIDEAIKLLTEGNNKLKEAIETFKEN